MTENQKEKELTLPAEQVSNPIPTNQTSLSPANIESTQKDNEVLETNTIKEKVNMSPIKEVQLQRRRSSYLEGIQNVPLQQYQETSFQENLAIFLQSSLFDNIIIFLVIIYTLIVFIYFALDNDDYSDNSDIILTLYIVQWIEFSILIIFSLEIILKVYALGRKQYFQDKWMVFDAIVIVFSIILLILDMNLDNSGFQTISKVLRSIFRFLRLFLVFRKINQFKKVKNLDEKYLVRTPVENILELIQNLKESIEDEAILKEFDYCKEKITSNQIYEPILDGQGGDIMGLIGNYTQGGNTNNALDQKISQQKLPPIKGKTLISLEANKADSVETTAAQVTYSDVQIPEACVQFFVQKNLHLVSFEVFEFHQQFTSNQLAYLMTYLFKQHNLNEALKIDPMCIFNLANKLSAGYQQVIYHNQIHSFDVTQTVNFFLHTCEFAKVANLSEIELAVMYVAAAAHDYDHPGTNNLFQVNTRSDLAITYNDKSPLQNHHCSQLFMIFAQDQKLNPFINQPRDVQKSVRQRIIGMILATDNAMHFTDQSKLKSRLASTQFDPQGKDKAICMESLLHAADISNPFQPINIYQQWVERVLGEFWSQGDQERSLGLPISYLCDRYTTNSAKSQIGFTDFFVKPFYDTIKGFIPQVEEFMGVFETNQAKWSERIEFYDQDLERLQKEKQQREQQTQPVEIIQ